MRYTRETRMVSFTSGLHSYVSAELTLASQGPWQSFLSYDPPQALADNTKPVLYAAGEKDPNVTPEVIRMIADGIGGPVTVGIVPDGVHQLMLFETATF